MALMSWFTKKSLPFILLVILLATPSLASAKNQNINSEKYARIKERANNALISLKESSQKSNDSNKLILSEIGIYSDKKIETEIDLYPTIAIIRIEPARPFYIFPRAKSASITISKLKTPPTQ